MERKMEGIVLRDKTIISKVRIKEVFPTVSQAEILSKEKEIKIGDRANFSPL